MKKPSTWLESVWNGKEKVPNALKYVAAKAAAIAVLCVAVGVYTGLAERSPRFALMSLVVAAYFTYRAASLYGIGCRGEYEAVKGRVSHAWGRRIPGRSHYTVQLTLRDGSRTDLVLDKNNKVTIGKSYRFYIKKGSDAKDGAASLLGYEEMEL